MDKLCIEGGQKLFGTIKAQGAKNAVTKQLVASLISDKPVLLKNVPNIQDVEVTVALCREIGSHIEWDRKKGTIYIVTKEFKTTYIPQRFSGSNRIPILMIGALLGRVSEDIIVPTSGGCNIGKRSVDFHIESLSKLGAHIEYRSMKKEGAYFAQAHRGLTGAEIVLPYPSVGATENSLLAALRAKGRTVIKNAAIEPEVIDLVLFLQKMGGNITVEQNRTIIVDQTKIFHEVEHTVMTDRIEAASYAMAAIATKGRVFIEGARQIDMIPFLHLVRKIGGDFIVKENGIEFFATNLHPTSLLIETDVHPGFMTDWQQPFVVCLTKQPGTFVIHETVYENRFGYIQMLKKMGANVELFSDCLGPKPCRFAGQGHLHSAIITGGNVLRGSEIVIPDLRAGFAYVMAALIAVGKSEISGLDYIDRGYEDVVGKLSALGAKIERLDNKKSKKEIIDDSIIETSFEVLSK